MAIIFCVGCHESPQITFDVAHLALEHGQVRESQEQAARAYRKYHASNQTWAWKFLILEAQAALERGLNDDVLSLLRSDPPPLQQPEFAIPTLMLSGVANVNKNNLNEAHTSIAEAAKLCKNSDFPTCGYVLQAQGLLASAQSDTAAAENFYQRSLSFARSHHDSFLEANSLLNLGAESLTQGRYDQAIDRSEDGYRVAKAASAGILQLVTQGNAGWAYYKLGDADRALAQFLSAEKQAGELGDVADQGVWLTNAGYIYLDNRDLSLAEQYFQRALRIERGVDKKEHIYNALRALARLAMQTGDLANAQVYAEQAIGAARESNNHIDELYPLLVQGQIAARRGDAATAKQTFVSVGQDKQCPIFLKWEAQHSLARLYEDGKQPDLADRKYRAALATFESARADVRHEDFHLSFLTNGWRIYDDYIHFLVARGKPNDALRWADHSRARTLSEGLGFLADDAVKNPPPLNAPAIARISHGTILYYWLGEQQSFLWAITPQKTSLFTLPAGTEIDAAVQRYRTTLAGPVDALASSDNDGRWLYRTLVAPAQPLLDKDSTVFLIPDGSLNNLNFETLLVPDPKPHYWIEDATVASASSLRVLAAPYKADKNRERRLLLFGNSIAPNDKYPELLRAAAQMDSVARHFPASDRTVFARDSATPGAYLNSHPEQFTNLHFVAHGIASRLSPLDSAIVLSRSNADGDSFKLYARDIINYSIKHRLNADLVAISACYGTGDRSYVGEGLVGLSWAFLRAGSHNVIAALWDASAASTEKLMAHFYDELDQGSSPGAALRTAKLSLLHSTDFNSPFYWAPFQLYTQGVPSTSNLSRASARQTAFYNKNRVTSPAAIPRQTTTE